MNGLLEVEDLHVRFTTRQGEVKALNGLTFSLQEESVLCLVGESGAGKSTAGLTTMRLLPRNGRVVSGRIYFEGMDLLSLDSRSLRGIRGKDIAMVPQEPKASLNPLHTIGAQVAELLMAHTRLPKKGAMAMAAEMLGELGLPDPGEMLKRYPFQLSGGMCQRVMIAMALALRPKLLIADEPTSNLDVTLQAEILRRLKRFCKEFRASMVLITHDMGIVAEMADDVAVMYAGTVVESGDVHTVFDRPMHPYMSGLIQSIPRLDRPDQRFQAIAGDPPDMLNLPEECPFLPRCNRAVNRCRVDPRPSLRDLEPSHQVACYNARSYEPVDGRGLGQGRMPR